MKTFVKLLALLVCLCLLSSCGKKSGEVLSSPEPSPSAPSSEVTPLPSEDVAPEPLVSDSIIIPGSEINYVSGRAYEAGIVSHGLFGDNVFEGLLYMSDSDPESIEGLLAESWSSSDDALEWTFTLREGILFSDVTVCDAYAVAAWWDTVRDTWGARATLDSWWAEDERTFVVKLTEPNYIFDISVATDNFYYVLNAEAYGADVAIASMVGTGPYRIESVGDTIVLKARDDYWGERKRPQIETVNLIQDYTKPATWLIDALLSGETDGADADAVGMGHYVHPEYEVMSPCDVAVYLKENNYDGSIIIKPEYEGYFAMDVPNEPIFEIKEVRQALALLIDRNAINDELYHGLGFVSDSIWTEDNPLCVSGGFDYNPDLALELLAQAGLTAQDISFEDKVSESQMPLYDAIAKSLNSNGAKVTFTQQSPLYPGGMQPYEGVFVKRSSVIGVDPLGWAKIAFEEQFADLRYMSGIYTPLYDEAMYAQMVQTYLKKDECRSWAELMELGKELTGLVQEDVSVIPAVAEPACTVLSSKFENASFSLGTNQKSLRFYSLTLAQ